MNQLQMLKMALISYVTNMGKAIWSAIAHPLTIKGKKNGNLIGYRMYGNSKQSGTPTPSSPKEISSVGIYDEASGKYKIPVKVTGIGKEEVVNIYLDKPLCKVGDYKDEIDFEKGQVIRRVYQQRITKIETKSSTYSTYYLYLNATDERPLVGDRVANCISNKFKTGNYTYTDLSKQAFGIKTYKTSGGAYRIVYSLSSKALEDAQKEIGDGFDVIYVLNTAITENIDLTPLPQFNGTTTYEVLTDAPPSGIEVCYYG